VFDLNTIFQETSDYLLPQGQLTSQGFFQHLQLGSILQQRYEEYFHKIHTPEQIYVRSTNYARTIRVKLFSFYPPESLTFSNL
jgi:hypothetical protein